MGAGVAVGWPGAEVGGATQCGLLQQGFMGSYTIVQVGGKSG